jgi:rubrerythrin
MDDYYASLNKHLIDEYNDVAGYGKLLESAPESDKPILRDLAIEESRHAAVISDMLEDVDRLKKSEEYAEAKKKAEKTLQEI